MFTIVPSLYLLSLDFFRRWNSSSSLKPAESIKPDWKISTIDLTGTTTATTTDDDAHRDRSEKVGRIRKKRSHQRRERRQSPPAYRMERRRTFTEELLEDDVNYLIQRTSFTREQIELWHHEFLVSEVFFFCLRRMKKKRKLFFRCFSVIVQRAK